MLIALLRSHFIFSSLVYFNKSENKWIKTPTNVRARIQIRIECQSKLILIFLEKIRA